MELDLGQVRAFVAAAEHEHFGRAADSLMLTQQALSKRIAGLESQLGTVFERSARGATLNARGRRLLPAAYQLLAAADNAQRAGLGDGAGPLRVDVWGPINPPQSAVRAFAIEHSEAIVEVSTRRNLRLALAAVARNELDLALGNIDNLHLPLPAGLSSRLVAVTELAALVADSDDAAELETVDTAYLRQHGVAVPIQSSRREFADCAAEFADEVGAPTTSDERNADLDELLDRISADPRSITFAPADWPVPPGSELRIVPIHPTPLFPWYAVWRTDDPHPLLPQLITALETSGGLAAVAADGHWLPRATRRRLTTTS